MIILTFCSEEGVKIPQYTYYCIKALRHYNPDMPIHFLARPNHGFEKVFKDLGVEWFDYSGYSTYEIEKFNETCDLKKHGTPNTTYPSPPNFFYGAMARLFYIGAHVQKYEEGISEFYHLENDVLVYYPFKKNINDSLDIMYPVMGNNLSTFSIVKCKSVQSWEVMLMYMLKYIDMGEQKFCKTYGADMFNEMTAAYVFACETSFADDINDLLHQNYFFDPGSCGQYLGGTNNGHGPGWHGDHHYIGKEIMDGNVKIWIENKKPMIEFKTESGILWKMPLFNLHVHSKNLKDFIDVEAR